MTVENCLRLLKEYEEIKNNPDTKPFQKTQATKAYDNMKEHIATASKFKNIPQEKLEEEKLEDGKKPKG